MRTLGTKMAGLVGAILLMALAGSAIVAQGQKSAEELYQSALVMKEGRGDLEGAIKLFARILADFPKDRAVTGKAQLQIGLCYEKLGESKAQEAYRKVIADFGDQTEVVKVAQERLAVLAKPAVIVPTAAGGMTLRQVDLPSSTGQVSPDGRWFASGVLEDEISLFDISTKTKRILKRITPGQTPYPFIESLEWAPSSQQLAFIFQDSQTIYSVHIIDLAGANEKIVYQTTGDRRSIQSALWSINEDALFMVLSDNSGPKRRHSIGNLKLATGDFREIKSYEGDTIGNPVVSPDGRTLACSLFPERGSGRKYSLITIDTNSGQETLIEEHPELSIPTAWAPNRTGLIFTSSRSGTWGLWLFPIQGGKKAGEPRLIREFSSRFTTMGIVANALYINESQWGAMDVYLAQIDLSTGKTLKSPEPLERDYRGVTSAPCWSPDGREIAYLFQSSHRPSNLLGAAAFDTLRIRDLESNEVRDFRSPVQRTSSAWPRWSPDRKHIYLVGPNPGPLSSAVYGVYRIDTKTGEATLIHILKNEPGGGVLTALTANGKYAYKVYTKQGGTPLTFDSRIVRMDMDTKEESELYKSGTDAIAGVQLSDDDKWLAFRLNPRERGGMKFGVMSATGGEVRIAYEKKPGSAGSGNILFFWGPPGKGYLFRTFGVSDEGGFMADLWHVADLEKGEPKMLELKVKNIYISPGPSFSPDGKTLAYLAAEDHFSRSWILENFLPPNKPGK